MEENMIRDIPPESRSRILKRALELSKEQDQLVRLIRAKMFPEMEKLAEMVDNLRWKFIMKEDYSGG